MFKAEEISKGVLDRNKEKIEPLCTSWPTGYSILDIMLGENKRDLTGKLVNVFRGFETRGKQYGLAATPGAGKTTLVGDMLTFPLHIGMEDCVHSIIVINSDNGGWDYNRIRKLSNLDMDTIKRKFKIFDVTSISEVVKILEKESEEYNKLKLRPVKFYDPFMDMERQMYPSVAIVIDTITSLTDAASEKDVLAKQQGMTTYLDISNFSNNVGTYFGGNSFTLWIAHLKENKPAIGQTVADKEFKASPSKWKSHMPVRIRQKMTAFLWLTKTEDMENQESPRHPIQVYGLHDLETKSVFVTNGITVKSRTGTEGRTIAKLVFINGKFDEFMTMLASCLVLGVLQEGSGMHPSADNPSIFKNQPGCEAEYAAQGRRSKKILTLVGYDRPTNIIEARLLLNYNGENEEILEKKYEFMRILQSSLEDKLYYELETNNLSVDELVSNQKRIKSLLGFIKGSKRGAVDVTKESIEASTPESKLEEYC